LKEKTGPQRFFVSSLSTVEKTLLSYAINAAHTKQNMNHPKGKSKVEAFNTILDRLSLFVLVVVVQN